MDDCQEFSVIDVIVSFGRGEGLGQVQAGVPITIGVSLEEDGTGSIPRCVSGNSKRF